MMPYPTPNRFLTGEGSLKYGSPEEKNKLLVNAWSDALRHIRSHPKYDLKTSAVLGAHVHVHGSTVGPSLFRITEEEDVVVQGGDLQEQFDYVALGHIHKPQWLGATHVRYSGSIERMDLGESRDDKGVVLFELFCGRLPFPAESPLQIVVAHMQNAPPKPRSIKQSIPVELEAVILKCLEKDRGKRYQTVDELTEALNAISERQAAA